MLDKQESLISSLASANPCSEISKPATLNPGIIVSFHKANKPLPQPTSNTLDSFVRL